MSARTRKASAKGAKKKAHERFIVEEAAKHLGSNWQFQEDAIESPDFIISDGIVTFGLEVTEVFTDSDQGDPSIGSKAKAHEAEQDRLVAALRVEYQKDHNTTLNVQVVGNLTKEILPRILCRLRHLDPERWESDHRRKIKLYDKKSGPVCLFVAHRPIARWIGVEVGWVRCQIRTLIDSTIKSKAQKIPDYRCRAGTDDIRLLIYADRTRKSGKLILEGNLCFDLNGFSCVYFYSHPESVTVIQYH